MENEQTNQLSFIDIDYEKIKENTIKEVSEKGFTDFEIVQSAIKENIIMEFLNQRKEYVELYKEGKITFRD